MLTLIIVLAFIAHFLADTMRNVAKVKDFGRSMQ